MSILGTVHILKVVIELITRSELRKKIMTILYQIELYDKNKIDYDLETVIKQNTVIDSEFVKDIVFGVVTYKSEIDSLANKHLSNWSIDRLGNTDIAILRMGIYELIYTSTPPVVAINEAVELAKEYSDEKVCKMINACLDKIYKEEEK